MSFLDRLLNALGFGPPSKGSGRQAASTVRADLIQATIATVVERDRKAKRERLDQLVALGNRRQPGDLDALLAALDDPDDEVKAEALLALRRFGAQALPSIDRLLLACSHPAERVRLQAIGLLCPGGIDPGAQVAMPVLTARLRDDPAAAVRREAVCMIAAVLNSSTQIELRWMGAEAVVGALSDPEVVVRQQAAFNLGYSFPHLAEDPAMRAKIAGALVRALRDADAHVRMRAATGLPTLAPDELAPLDELLTLLCASDQDFQRKDAAEALARLEGPDARRRVEALLGDPAPGRRLAGAYALLFFDDGAGVGLPVIEQALRGEPLRMEALELLGLFWGHKGKLKPLGPALLGLIDGAPLEQQRLVFRLFSRVFENDLEAIKLTLRYVQQGPEVLRGQAIDVLGNICKDADRVVPMLRQVLASGERESRRDAARVVGWFRERGAPALPELLALLKASPDRASDDHLLFALRSIGPLAREAGPLLVPLLASPKAATRDEALNAVLGVGAAALLLDAPVIEQTRALLKTSHDFLKISMMSDLAREGARVAPLCDEAAALLSSSNANLRYHALALLIAAGPAARQHLASAVPMLDEQQLVRVLGLLKGAPLGEEVEGQVFEATQKLLRPLNARNLLDAVEGLGERGVLALLGASMHELEAVGFEASRRIERLGEAHVGALARAAARPEAAVRLRAVQVLAQLGPAAHGALRGLLDHPDELLRSQAEIALGLP